MAAYALEAEGLCLRLSGKPIVRGVDLHLELGQAVGILGPNGAAKTSLLRALCGLLPLSQGRALLFGRPIGSYTRRELARRLAYVPQNAGCDFNFTLRQLVRMGRYPHLSRLSAAAPGDAALVEEALAKTGLTAYGDRLARTLSGGEWQRALIARALCQQADCLLLDEPTAALDIAHQNGVLALLRGLAGEGRLVLLVLHDINLAAAYCDHLLLMQEGRGVAFGPPEQVLRPELLSQVYGCPVRSVLDEETGRQLYYGLSPA